ncbi:MAG: N-6 DNA methylase [Archaeoglobales archaeon]|nr:N-6 DNA methylase [Archaeoglobales archaeon]
MTDRITERTLYPSIQRVFNELGAKVISEVKYVSIPDFVVEWLGEHWIISIKIGDPNNPRELKEAFMQYVSHMRDVGTEYGMIVFYPNEIKKRRTSADDVEDLVRNCSAYFIVLNPQLELRSSLPVALKKVEDVLSKRIPVSLSLETVVALLKTQIEELMEKIQIDEAQIMGIISDPKLFFGINPVEKDEVKRKEIVREASKFLASYIFLSQVLFVRFYSEEKPSILRDLDLRKIQAEDVREIFRRIKEINYRPIFELDVIDFVKPEMIQDTFNLLFSIQIKNIRFELPGRLFHELMPKKIRKLLAAFYTRPIAAYLLSLLTIEKPDVTVFDPACGSGTILTMAYRKKLELWREGKSANINPHKIFCEEQIFGCDLMPFAVHLSNANLAAMDPLTTINSTQIILGDALKLLPYEQMKPGFYDLTKLIGMDQVNGKGYKRTGEEVQITLKPVDVILMNPPFTKLERGIRDYIDTSTLENVVGGEVGLWGHFIALADVFLKEDGFFGAVIPINVLRGRESEKVREIIFKKWLPLYVIKASKNYGFSEYSEYRDLLVVAKKTSSRSREHKVKFCMIKKDLNKLREDEVRWISQQIKEVEELRSDLLDLNSHLLSEVLPKFTNMMPFISGPSFEANNALKRIIEEAERILDPFPENYFREGYGPRPSGTSSFMFITRPISESRIQEAFLILDQELEDSIIAKTHAGVQKFKLSKRHFLPALRTPVGLSKMDVTEIHDYVAKEPYENIEEIKELCEFKGSLSQDYWTNYIKTEFKRSTSQVAVIRRINPYSPNQSLIAHYSNHPIILANVFHVVGENEIERCKALVVLLNSIFFLAYFFNIKEETTGRYTELRHYDLDYMKLCPKKDHIKKLAEIYDKYCKKDFPPLREQMDLHFEERYEWFWLLEKEDREDLTQPPPIETNPLRLEFDLAVIEAVGARLADGDLKKAYEAIVWDMIITRGLSRD